MRYAVTGIADSGGASTRARRRGSDGDAWAARNQSLLCAILGGASSWRMLRSEARPCARPRSSSPAWAYLRPRLWQPAAAAPRQPTVMTGVPAAPAEAAPAEDLRAAVVAELALAGRAAALATGPAGAAAGRVAAEPRRATAPEAPPRAAVAPRRVAVLAAAAAALHRAAALAAILRSALGTRLMTAPRACAPEDSAFLASTRQTAPGATKTASALRPSTAVWKTHRGAGSVAAAAAWTAASRRGTARRISRAARRAPTRAKSARTLTAARRTASAPEAVGCAPRRTGASFWTLVSEGPAPTDSPFDACTEPPDRPGAVVTKSNGAEHGGDAGGVGHVITACMRTR
jgi:hypothetical protein